MKINDPPEKEGGVADHQPDAPSGSSSSGGSTHQILKPEPTKSGSSGTKTMGVAGSYPAPPTSGSYGSKQPHPHPGGYHPSMQGSEGHQYPHTMSLSQPMPGAGVMPTPPMSLSQGPAYYHHPHAPPTSRGDSAPSAAPPTGPHYAGGGAPYGGTRQKLAYENVPIVYETLQSNARHAHMPHPQPPPPSGYGGAKPGSYNPHLPPGHNPAHKPHSGPPHEYPLMRPYNMGAGPRWKPVNPASINVAHDAAASGDIATLVRGGRGERELYSGDCCYLPL